MAYSYLVLGAGRQGVAAAYDLARFGNASRVTLADFDQKRAQAGADKVNNLVHNRIAGAIGLDVRDEAATQRALKGYDVALSAVPYLYNLALTRAAIAAGVSFCDMGGNTDIVQQQHALDPEARHAGVSIIPDCGMGPGMGNTLAVYAMDLVGDAGPFEIAGLERLACEPIQPAPQPRTAAPNSAPKRPGIASWKRPLIMRMPAKMSPPKQITAPA